ncbi:MAG: TerB family tellurite resistance protein [Maribacter sp.]|nr:TerB family tellurite resistance protein [Maribacter sp.]
MSILEVFETGKHGSNLSHFAAIVKMAGIDGSISNEEKAVLKRLALKLDVSEEEFKPIFKNPRKYPLIPPYSLEERIERLHDLCSVIYADHIIDDSERKLIFKYAIGLGFTTEQANVEIQKCIRI